MPSGTMRRPRRQQERGKNATLWPGFSGLLSKKKNAVGFGVQHGELSGGGEPLIRT